MAYLMKEWPLTMGLLVYLVIYFIIVNANPALAEYTASIGIVLGIVTWIKYHVKYKKAVRASDQRTKKEYKTRIAPWMLFYLITIIGTYFAYFKR